MHKTLTVKWLLGTLKALKLKYKRSGLYYIDQNGQFNTIESVTFSEGGSVLLIGNPINKFVSPPSEKETISSSSSNP
jgi:hypothetical protein